MKFPGANITTTTELPLLDPNLADQEFFRIRSGNNINSNIDNIDNIDNNNNNNNNNNN